MACHTNFEFTEEMLHYHDKIVSIDFMWDQPIDEVMGYQAQHSLSMLNQMLPNEIRQFTLRELQCFFHIIQARSAKQIGQALGISSRTVESHTSKIKEKLRLATTRAVIEYAHEHNLISLSPLLQSIFNNDEKTDE